MVGVYSWEARAAQRYQSRFLPVSTTPRGLVLDRFMVSHQPDAMRTGFESTKTCSHKKETLTSQIRGSVVS